MIAFSNNNSETGKPIWKIFATKTFEIGEPTVEVPFGLMTSTHEQKNDVFVFVRQSRLC